MRTVLYTGFDSAYRPLAELTLPRMSKYASLRGMEFQACPDAPVLLNIYWTGMARGLELFNQGFDAVMYLDADQLITNFDVAWPPMVSGIHLSKDWGHDAVEPWHFSACGFMAFRNAIPFFERVLELEPQFRDLPFQEQAPMREVVRKWMEGVPLREKGGNEPENGLINIHPRRVFNSVPAEMAPPGTVPEPWDPTCFAAHLTMGDMTQRIAVGKKILQSL